MQPRHKRETVTPVRPSNVYFIKKINKECGKAGKEKTGKYFSSIPAQCYEEHLSK